MRQYQKETKEIEIVQRIICNKCGKEIPVSNGRGTEGVFHVDYTWGYFSEKDGEHHTFDLCEACYDAWLKEFRIPAEIEG